MNFQFTEEQIMIQESAKEFAVNEIAPTAVERDKNAVFPTEIVKQMGELGFMGMMVSPNYGGAARSANWRWKRVYGHNPRRATY